MNEYIRYYSQNQISPVRQNITDFGLHIKKRELLYQRLGIPKLFFKEKDILEVGPGSGFNSLATFTFSPARYDLIEPNPYGFDDLQENFKRFGFPEGLQFYNLKLEEFQTEKTYDIVICEGLIQGLSDKKNFLNRLTSFVKPGGVLIITTGDQISMFYETIRRYFALLLVSDRVDFKDKIAKLTGVFSPHLDTLEGMSRRYDDWCADLLCKAILNHDFSIKEALEILGEEFYFYNSSPSILMDWRWYKEVPEDTNSYNRKYMAFFNSIRHGVFDYRVEVEARDEEKNEELARYCLQIASLARRAEMDKMNVSDEMVFVIKAIKENLAGETQLIDDTLDEISSLMKSKNAEYDLETSIYFKSAFGRGQIFVSFVKEDKSRYKAPWE